MREGAGRRLLHREELHGGAVYVEMATMAFDGGIGHEKVHVRVVLQRSTVHLRWRGVHKATKEPECLVLREADGPHSVGQLNLERLAFLVELRDCAIELCFEQRECPAG